MCFLCPARGAGCWSCWFFPYRWAKTMENARIQEFGPAFSESFPLTQPFIFL